MGGKPGSYGVIDVYTRVSEFHGWIKSVEGKPQHLQEPGWMPDVRCARKTSSKR